MTPVALALAALTALQQGPIAAPTLRDLIGVAFDARVTAVADGDTVDVLPDGDKRAIRVRLDGVDCPERGEPFSQEARTFTRVLLFDQRARAEGRDVDRYGRLVARLRVASKDASVELVRAGLACHFIAFSSDAVLARAETEARAAGRGFWAGRAPKPRCALGRATAGIDTRPNPRPLPATTMPLHGNTASRVYHAASCRNYRCKDCTRTFTTEKEAQAAGFRPASDCLRPR